ncbi:hypothetical protein TPA0905_12330 [Streptomyces olivaceus]|nr:hypothetical protein TPA0905_12330 [Streptomyces olivaceus]
MTRRCDCCGTLIVGEPRAISPDLPTGAAPTVWVCPDPCRPKESRRTAPPSGFNGHPSSPAPSPSQPQDGAR